jgi:hypothetical protein
MPFNRTRRGPYRIPTLPHWFSQPSFIGWTGTVAGRSVFHVYDQLGVRHKELSTVR